VLLSIRRRTVTGVVRLLDDVRTELSGVNVELVLGFFNLVFATSVGAGVGDGDGGRGRGGSTGGRGGRGGSTAGGEEGGAVIRCGGRRVRVRMRVRGLLLGWSGGTAVRMTVSSAAMRVTVILEEEETDDVGEKTGRTDSDDELRLSDLCGKEE
jgi:hypothetical protein